MERKIERFGLNTTGGRDLIVGDIHGHFTKLQAALDAIRFDPERDRLFSVGDLVDRGPESDVATDWLEKPWFRAVAGNHEDYAIRWPNGNMDPRMYTAHGGGWNVSNPPEEQRRLADAFAALPIGIELDTTAGKVGIVHADCPLNDWDEFCRRLEDPATPKRDREALVDAAQWSRTRAEKLFDGDVRGVVALVVGHDPKPRMTTLGNVIYIDTYAWRDGHFTILDAHTLRPAEAPSRLDWSGVA